MKPLRTIFIAFFLIFTHDVFAADECSVDYIGKATLNEIFVKHQGGGQSRGYIEVKVLDGSSAMEYDNWKVKICIQNSCATIPLSSANDSNLPWIYFDKNDFDINLIDFENGFDLSLLDASDNFIDYISVENVDRQNFGVFCNKDDLPYDFPIPDTGNGTKLLHRTPDGVGSWTALSSNNGESPGEGNTDPTNNPILIISDDAVMQGQNENFTISVQDSLGVPAYSLDDIKIVYYTINDSAISPEHYTGKGNTPITIPAGFNSVTIPIETVFIGDQVTRRFYLQYSADVFVSDNLGVGTIIPSAASVPLALYRFEQTDLSAQIDDTSGNNNHADIPFIGASLADGKYCRGFDSVSYNRFNYTGTAFRSDLDLDDDVGLQGTISFWFNSSINWNDDFERVLFDASSGSTQADKYFVLEIQEDGRLKFAFEDSVDSDFSLIESSTNNRQADTWYYLTVTWDYLANDFAIYVDGNLQIQDTKNTNGAMGELDQIVFGDNSSDYTQIGNSPIASPYSSRGNYDEVRIYNKVLTQTEIQTDMNDDNGCAAELIAHYQMDELSWSGANGEVLNELGTLHGTAVGGLTTARVTPARPFNPGTCGYGYFDGDDDYVEIADDPTLGLADSLTITTWIYPTKLPSGSSDLMTILSKDENYEFHVTPSGEINWWWNDSIGNIRSLDSTNANITINKWHHIAISYKDGEQIIYVNGVEDTRSTHSGELIVNSDPLQIGQDQFHPGRYFQGSIDEVKIYDGALSATEVNDIYLETHPCDNYIDHFEIDALNAQGLTCEPDTVTLRACSDASCNTLNHDNQVVSLIVSEGNTPVITKEVTIVGGEIDVDYRYTKQGVVTLSLDQTYECINGSPTDCDITFSDAGFRFVSVGAGNITFPTQLAGKPSNIGYNADTLNIEAVKTSSTTGACAPLLIGEPADVTVIDMAASYQTPTTGSHKVNISGTDVGTAVSGSAFDSLPFTGVTLDFRDLPQHSAEYIFTYPDAGAVQLHARFELPDDEGNPSGNFIKGSSNPVYVRPFAFDMFIETNLDNSDSGYNVNPEATSATGDIFTVAGQSLLITYTAKAWQAGDDANANGLADENEELTNNATTTNYTNESLTSLNYSEVAPLGGITDALDIIDTTAQFINGSKTDEISYDEVGIVSLTAKRDKYLSIDGLNIQGYAPYVGRFTPEHFKVTQLTNGDIWAYCNSVDMQTESLPFAYSGQLLTNDATRGALVYEVTPGFVIEARNKKNELTKNYIDTFFKLNDASFTRLTLPDANNNPILAPIEDAINPGKDPLTKVRLTANLGDGSFVDDKGVITYSYHNNDNFIYAHESNSEVIEFPADIDLTMVSIIDGDTVVTQDEDNDVNNGIFTLNPTAPLIRFGRAQLKNSYGPDTSDLPQTLSINYFTENGYALSATDICTRYDSQKITLTSIDLDPAKTPVKEAVTGSFSDEQPFGETRSIILTAPTTSSADINTGQVAVIYDISDWLKYDWAYDVDGADGLYNDNPRAIATFGIYRGNDRIIYQREIAK